MSESHRQRVQRVQDVLVNSGLDYLFISISPDLYYLTGYDGSPSERLHMLVIPSEGTPTLVFPEFERELVADLGEWIDIVCWSETEDPVQLVRRSLPSSERDFALQIGVGDHTRAVFLLRLQKVLRDRVGPDSLPVRSLARHHVDSR